MEGVKLAALDMIISFGNERPLYITDPLLPLLLVDTLTYLPSFEGIQKRLFCQKGKSERVCERGRDGEKLPGA